MNSDERERKPHPKHKSRSSAISPSITANSPSRPYPSPPGEKPTPPRLKEPCALNKNALSLRITPSPLKARSFKSPNLLPLAPTPIRSEEHTSELQSLRHLVCRLL